MKVTALSLRCRIKDLQRLGFNIHLNKNIQGYRVSTNNEGRDISDRLKGHDMDIWLQGFITGVRESGRKPTTYNGNDPDQNPTLYCRTQSNPSRDNFLELIHNDPRVTRCDVIQEVPNGNVVFNPNDDTRTLLYALPNVWVALIAKHRFKDW